MIGTSPRKCKSTITHSPTGMQITIPRLKLLAPLWGFVGVSVGLVGVALLSVSQYADLISALLGYGLGLALSATGLFTVLYAFSGRTILTLQRDGLVARKEVCRIGWTRLFPAHELFDLRCWWIKAYEGGEYATPGIVFVHRGKTRRYGVGRLYNAEAEYLVAQIKTRYPKVNVIPPEPRFNKPEVTSFSFFGLTIEL